MMEFETQVRFESPPAAVRRAIMDYVADRFPKAADHISWDSTGTRATGSKMGASGTVRLTGRGPTVVEIHARIGFPASMAVSESRLRRHLEEAVRDLKKTTP
jgi:hypothetical protein